MHIFKEFPKDEGLGAFLYLPATAKFYQLTLPTTSAQEIIGRFHHRQGDDRQCDKCGRGFVCFSLPITSEAEHLLRFKSRLYFLFCELTVVSFPS